jgi:hypothetical protein
MKIRTGDTLLCGNNTATGFTLKFATSSKWNHAGIAICFKSSDIAEYISWPPGEDEILCIMEINSDMRYDYLLHRETSGFGISPFSRIKERYNYINVNHIQDKYAPLIVKNTLSFISLYRESQFSSGIKPFLGVWLGVPFVHEHRCDEKGISEYFCSEMMAHYYDYCLGNFLRDISDGPIEASLYKPGHFSNELSTNGIFTYEEEIYSSPCDYGISLFQPFIYALLFIVILWYILYI